MRKYLLKELAKELSKDNFDMEKIDYIEFSLGDFKKWQQKKPLTI